MLPAVSNSERTVYFAIISIHDPLALDSLILTVTYFVCLILFHCGLIVDNEVQPS